MKLRISLSLDGDIVQETFFNEISEDVTHSYLNEDWYSHFLKLEKGETKTFILLEEK